MDLFATQGLGRHWWQPTPSHLVWATKAWFRLAFSTKLASIIGQAVAVSIAPSQLSVTRPLGMGLRNAQKSSSTDNGLVCPKPTDP
jgi:hypothetical protein